MALPNDTNQGNNLESNQIEQSTGIKGAQDLSDIKPLEEVKNKELEAKIKAQSADFTPATIDPPTKKTAMPTTKILPPSYEGGKSVIGLSTQDVVDKYGKIPDNPNRVITDPTVKDTATPSFLDGMVKVGQGDTSISRPIDQSINFDDYKDYLSINHSYYDSNTGLDKMRAQNQGVGEQVLNANLRVLANVLPEGVKQIANAFDLDHLNASEDGIGNVVSDAMTEWQDKVKDALPIYRENPGKALDFTDSAYLAETLESLITSIGGFALAGYATAGVASGVGAGIAGAAELASTVNLGKKVADGIKASTAFQNALATAKAANLGSKAESLAVNFLLNQAEGRGIGAQAYADVYQREYNNAIVNGFNLDEAKTIAKDKAGKAGVAAINFNRVTMLLNVTSSDLFLQSPKNVGNLVKKEGARQLLKEGGQEAAEEYVNDLAQMYGESVGTDKPLTFKEATSHLATAQGIEAPILGFIGGAGQTALTKAGKYIQSSSNESYMRHFNQYIMEHPIDGTNKDSVIQSATAYAQAQADKDKPIGFVNRGNTSAETTSTAQQLESLYIAQQANLEDYNKASLADNMNDVVNATISSSFSVDLMNQIKNDPLMPQGQKDNLLERSLLSHQAYIAMQVGTQNQLKDLYRTYANMDEDTAKEKGLYNGESKEDASYYKTKAERAIKSIENFEKNYHISKAYVNSSEVYDRLNNNYFNVRDVEDLSKKHNELLTEINDFSRDLYEQEGNEEALTDIAERAAEGKAIVHPNLWGSKMEEDFKDVQKALKVAKDTRVKNAIQLNHIQSVKYNQELVETIKLYRTKQQSERVKKNKVAGLNNIFSKVFGKGKETQARTEKKKEEAVQDTNIPSSMGRAQTTTTPTTQTTVVKSEREEVQDKITNLLNIRNNDKVVRKGIADSNKKLITLEALDDIFKKWNDENGLTDLLLRQDALKATQAAPTAKNNYTPPPITNTTTPNNSVNDVTNNPDLFSFTLEVPGASDTMKAFLASDSKEINIILTSRFSLDSKIEKLKEIASNKLNYDLVNAPMIASDGEAVTLKSIDAIQAKIKELEGYKGDFSPDVIDEQQAYESDVVDFGLDLEEYQLEVAKREDEDGNVSTSSLDVLTSQFNIYSAILDQMAKRGIDTTNLENVMTEFKTILGTKLLKAEFNSLQGLFNFANNTTANSTYADLFNTTHDNDNDLDNFNRLAKVNIQTGEFVYDLDKESRMSMQTTKQGIITNNPDAEVKGLAYPIYNEIGGNKLAYLAQNYTKVISKQANEDGQEYYEVNKVTAENTVNSALDPAVLEEDFFNVDDEVTFVALDSFTDEDGNVVLAEDLPIGERPIGVIKNGELVKGLYLHTTSWITAENITNTPENIENDRQALLNLRTRIIDGEQVTSKITEVTTGAPISSANGEKSTFASEFPEFPVGIVRNGQIELANGRIETYPEFLHFEEGDVVSIVNGYYYYGDRTRLFPPMIAAIKSSLTAFATATHTQGTELLLNKTGKDLLKPKGVESYLRDFIYTAPLSIDGMYATNLEDFKNFLQTIPETRVIVNFIGNNFYIGRGGALDVHTISAGQYKGNAEALEYLLPQIDSLLQDSFANVSLQSLTANDPLHIISENGISKTFDTYEDYVKQVSVSPYVSITLPSGNKITTIQKRVSFDTPGIEQNSSKVPSTVTKKGTPKKPRTKKEIITTESGKQQVIEFTSLDTNNIEIDFDDVTEDFSPLVIDTTDLSPDVQDNPLESPSYINGLSLELQEAIVHDLVQEYYNLLLENRSVGAKIVTLDQFFDSKVAFFNDVVITAQERNAPIADKLALQVQVITKNKAQFLAITRQQLTSELKVKITDDKLALEPANITVSTTLEDVDSPDGVALEDVQEDSRVYAINEFAIDPKTQLSYEIKALLYGIIDAKLAYKEGVPNIVPRKLGLQIPLYVNPNVVYQDLMMLFSKSSINDGMNTANFQADENSDLHPKIQVAIEVLKSQYTVKPYYANIVEKLKGLDSKTQMQFVTTFNKNNTDHLKVVEYVNKSGEGIALRLIRNNNQNAHDQLIGSWNEAVKAIGGYVPGLNSIELADELYNAFINAYNQMAGNTTLHTYDNFKVLFSLVGITLSQDAFEKLRDGTYVNGRIKTLTQQFEHTEGWFKRIKDRVVFIKTNNLDANTLHNNDVFKELSDFILKFEKSVFNTSYRNGNGDTIYGVTNNRYFMERLTGLKNNAKLLKQLATNAFSSKSGWISELLNSNNGTINKGKFHSIFSYNTIDSYTVRANNKTKMVDSMNRKELLQLSLSLFYNGGESLYNKTTPVHTFIIPALSDKSNMFTIKAPGRFYNLTNNRLSDQDVAYLRTQLFEGEFHRIVQSTVKGEIGTKGYDSGARKFLMFPEFNNIEGLFDDGVINAEALSDLAIVERIHDTINDYVTNIIFKTYQDWSSLGLLKQGKENVYSDKMQFIDTAYAAVSKSNPNNSLQEASSVVLNYVTNYLVANANMQALIFNDPAFYYKKGKRDGETGAEITTDIAETWDNVTKRYAAVNGGKDDFAFPAGSTFSVLSINDTKVTSNTLSYLSSLWAGHPLEKEVIDTYSNMEPGDAQEYTSLEEHLDRMVYSSMIAKDKADRILFKYYKTGKVEKADLQTLLINFKPLYFNTFMGTKGVMETVYIKTSSFPLIKELTKGTQLDALRQYFEQPKNKVKVAVFASGIKAGNPAASLELFNSNGDLNASALKGNLNQFILRDLPREGHGNQQANPDKSKSQVINDGTQQAKLIFTNILDVKGFKNPFGEGELNGRDLATVYLNKYEQRFKAQYDKLMKELQVRNGVITNVAKLKKILVDEAISRGWTFNEASSFELDTLGLNFEIPLWMSISSSKIENLLSAIVDNRIRKRKRNGRSYILASEAGFKAQVLSESSDITGITFTDDYTGQLRNSYNADGEMTSAEILVPFRFYDNEGNLLNIKDFMVGNKLDVSKLPTNLLEGFGYRIPTSGINLMSNIKVVGFLPESYGDTIIAPADFTKQMGSDFDVDKFYSSLYATFYNKETKSLEKLTNTHEQARQQIVNNVFKYRNDLKRLANYKGVKKDLLIEETQAKIKLEESKPLYKLKNLDILVLDNELTDIQRSVLNNTAKEVQRARTKPLMFGRLEEMVKKFHDATTDKYYTFLNRDTQDRNYLNGLLGKTAVGNFSLDMILNSLGQYVTTPLFFQDVFTDKDGKTRVKESKIKAFGFSNNEINNPFLNDGSGRYKSDVLEGLMAAALDNGKEQILGKLGISDNTFDFIRAMVATGYNEEVIMGILAQPIIKTYLNPTTSFNTIGKMRVALSKIKGADTNLADFGLQTLTEDLDKFTSMYSNPKEVDKLMVTGFKENSIPDSALALQFYSLGLFLRMEKRGRALSQIRSALNVDSAGVGKNTIYSAGKLEQADAAKSNLTINNPYAYFVNAKYNPDTEEMEKISSSIGNSALFYGANTNYQLWNRYFPFDNEVVKRVITTIADRTGKDIFRLNSYSDYATLILKDFKSYLSAKPVPTILPTFMQGMNTNEMYKYIVHSTPNHDSLGEFILSLRNIKDEQGNVKYINRFLNDLNIKPVDKTTTSASNPAIVDINYASVNRVDNSENKVVNAIIDMLNKPIILGVWNGNSIDSRQLMNLLSTYQFISKGIPAPNKFIEFLPNNDLKRMGYYHQLDNSYSSFVKDNLNDKNKLTETQFLVQHLQHNMEDYYNSGTARAYEGYFENGLFNNADLSKLPNYIVFKDENGYHAQYKTKNGFVRLNPLGWGSNTEYNHDIINPTSINHNNNKSMVNVFPFEKVNLTTTVDINSIIIPTTTLIDSTLGKITDINITHTDSEGKESPVAFKAYPIVMTANGSKESFYLLKNGSVYNTIYHPVTEIAIPINGLSASTTKQERDSKIMEALSVLPANVITSLGLDEQVESFDIPSIEANIETFMTPSRDKQKDVFPSDINDTTRSFADELGLSDTSLNLEDKYSLIFDNIRRTVGEATSLGYFLAKAKEIVPALGNTPIVMDTTLKAKGVYKSNGASSYIVINPNKFTTIEEMANVIAHEAIHGLFKKQIQVKNPITKQLESLRKEVEALLIAEYGEPAMTDMRNKIASGLPLTRGVEADLLYGVHNLDEFITNALTNPAFQTYLNSKDIKLANKSIWQKLMDLLSGLLTAIGVRKDSKFADVLGGIFALTDDIRKNHLKAFPKAKWARSLDFINDKFNLVSDTNELLSKGNPDEIALFINDNFVNTTATVIDNKYVQITPTTVTNTEDFMPLVSDDQWDFSFLNLEQQEREINSEIRANYYQYGAMLRARVTEGEKAVQKAQASGDSVAIEQAKEKLLADKVNLMNIPKLKSLRDLELKAKEDLDRVAKVLAEPMNSEDIIYTRNVLNFWSNVREYTFTPKHTESESLMRTFSNIEDDAQTATKKLALIEKTYLESFIKDTLGREITLDDVFSDYKDVSQIKSYSRDISTYDNALLTAIWKKVQLANMQAEEEASVMLSNLDSLIQKVMPKLNSVNSKSPFEIFRQLSDNGKKTNHLISPYSSKYFNAKSGILHYAKELGTADAVNKYAKWVKSNTAVVDLNKYFPQDGIVTPEVEQAREELKNKIGDFRYNLWFNGQNRKINSYLKRREAIEAKIKEDLGLDLSAELGANDDAFKALKNWDIKHSPYEFSKIINSAYDYYSGLEGVDGFQHYEVLPSKPDHFNEKFNTIAADEDLMDFYTEFSSLYEDLKKYIPSSQLSNLIYGGLPVLEQSIYQAYSVNGCKSGFKGIKSALVKATTSSYSNKNKQEIDLVTGENAKHMYVAGITSDSGFIKDYVSSESLKYEVANGVPPTEDQIDAFKEEAIHLASQRRDFDLGKMMKLFGTIVISHKQIASIEDLIKIGQYTLNSYKEVERNPDGTPATTVLNGVSTLPSTTAFANSKKSLAYFIDSQIYGNIKDEEGVMDTKWKTAEEQDIAKTYKETLVDLEAQKASGEITPEFYESLKGTIESRLSDLGSNVVASKIGDSWLKYVQIKLMGWNILGGISNSVFGFVSNMIEASGEGSFTLDDMNNAYAMSMGSVAKNLTFNKWEAGESSKIRNAMDKMNVLKEASHELYTSNDVETISGKFKFASPYNMNQRTEYLNQAPIMIIMAKKTFVNTPAGRISIWEGMNKDWEWDTEKYGAKPVKAIMDMRIAITKHIQRLHGNYDPASPLMIKQKFVGRAVSQFRTWLYESVATRFEKERFEDALGVTVKGRYRTLGGLLFENENRLGLKQGSIEFSKALLNAFTFGKAKLKSFQGTNLSDIDAQNMRKIAMEMVLLLDTFILIALLKAGLSDDDEESQAMYNVLLNQGTRLKSDLLLYTNPAEARNIIKDIIPAISLFDDATGFMKAVINLEDDEIKSGVHKGNSRIGTSTMKLIPGASKAYGTYNSMSQVYDKTITAKDEDEE